MVPWGNEQQDALIAELLGGIDGAQYVLADFLEERGDAGLADYARNDLPMAPHGRLDFALGLMPYRAAVFAGCGFLEHVIRQRRPDINSCDHQLCLAAWEAVEQMSYEESGRSPPADIRAADRSLKDAFLRPSDSRSRIKSLAHECRSYRAQRRRPLQTIARREADWQCQHARDVLTGKITSWVSGDLHATEISRTVLKVEHDEVR